MVNCHAATRLIVSTQLLEYTSKQKSFPYLLETPKQDPGLGFRRETNKHAWTIKHPTLLGCSSPGERGCEEEVGGC